jgi:hypothetical protein
LVLLCALLLSSQSSLADFTQQGAKLFGTGAVGGALQGSSVSLSADGNTAIVGGPIDNHSAGAAWVYTRSGTTWTQQGSKLFGTGAVGAAGQGGSVALSSDGNTAIVGGPSDNGNAGAAWVYTRSGTTWTQQGSKLVGTGAVGAARQGISVALSSDGNTAIVGGNRDNNVAGAAWVYTRSGGVWTQQGSKLFGTGAVRGAFQGVSVSLSSDGNTAIVGGHNDNNGAGAAWVYTRSGGVWTQQGSKLFGTGAVGDALQGHSVALSADGNTAIVGGYGDDAAEIEIGATGIGAAWVYTRSGTTWTQQGGKLVGTGAVGGAQQGISVSLSADGNTAIVGGERDNNRAGAAWVYARSGTTWTQQGSKLGGTGAVGAARQGISVALSSDGNTAIVGGPFDNFFDNDVPGAAWVFVQSTGLVSTSTTLSSSANPSVFGQSVTFTATVTGTGATGTVTFKDGGTTLGTGSLSGGTATFASSALTVGAHTITAVYGGDASFATSTSPGVTQTVNPGATTTSVVGAPNPSVFGQSVTFTATVAVTSPAAGTPTGTVTFMEGARTLGTGTLSGGTATYATSALTVGNHKTITAVYGGDGNFATSTSPDLVQTVSKNATTTSVIATPNPSKPGQSVTFTATVAVTPPATGTPTGTVTFKEGAKTLGTGTLSAGNATFSTAALTIRNHTITASFAGTATLASSKAWMSLAVDPRVGPEFRFNNRGVNSQQQPSIARLSDNGLVAAWASNGQDRSGYGIYARRYNAAGTKLGNEFLVNTTTVGNQLQPATAGLTDGFVITWLSGHQDGSGGGIYGQRYDNAGVKADSEFPVNTYTASNQSLPSVAGLAGGGFVVAWVSQEQDKWGLGVYAQRYDIAGKAAGKEFRVNTTTTMGQSQPSVAALTGGGFVVTWQSNGQDGRGLGVYGQRYDSTGLKAGTQFRVNTTTAMDQSQPSVAGLSDGGFVATWQSDGTDGSLLGVYGQRYDNTGLKAGAQFRVNTTTAMDQWQPSVAAFADGGFVVTWTSNGQDGSGQGVYAQAYDAAGNRVDVEFRVNTTTAMDQWQPSVAAFSGGSFVVAWTSQNQDGSLEGVYGQRFKFYNVTPSAQPAAATFGPAKPALVLQAH